MNKSDKIRTSKSLPFSRSLTLKLHIFLNVLQTRNCLGIYIVYLVRAYHANRETRSRYDLFLTLSGILPYM